MSVNIYEQSETLFRRQLATMFTGLAGGTSAGFTSLLLTPITTTQKNAMANVKGTLVYDGTLNKLCQNTGAGWETVTSV